jgi:hypothetical protein
VGRAFRRALLRAIDKSQDFAMVRTNYGQALGPAPDEQSWEEFAAQFDP